MKIGHTPKYHIYHFSLSLPSDEDQADIPRLLEHLSDTLRDYKDISIIDIVFHGDVYVDNELHPQFTVYYDFKKHK